MDTEQQIRLNFLDEAQEYFDLIESNLLGLANRIIEPQQIDLILRAAHSVKGGAGMMNFKILSRSAHRLEDFFKILRVRYASSSVSTEVETLLLQSLDSLHQISDFNRQGVELDDSWFREHAEPIFEQLRQHLGDLQDADEDALMSQDEDVNPALLMFEEGVDAVLERFETQLSQLAISELFQELVTTSKELIAFGQMANLEPFTELCQSVKQEAENLSQTQLESLAERALKSWKRSHALVVRGKLEKLPSRLENVSVVNTAANYNTSTIEHLDSTEKSDVLSTLEVQDELANFDNPTLEKLMATDLSEVEANFALLTDDSCHIEGFTELKVAFDREIPATQENHELEIQPDLAELVMTDLLATETDLELLADDSCDFENLTELKAAFELERAVTKDNCPLKIEAASNSLPDSQPVPEQTVRSVAKMVRVPLKQLKQFNNLLEQLVLERNTINLRLKQLQNATTLMRQRMSQIERSNTHLKQWYDRASVAGFLTNIEQPLKNYAPSAKSMNDRFDTLEMDQYSDVHLICQEQIETIVQLQEVTTDIELGLQDINQAVHELNHTTKSLQSNVTRTQMVPFAEVVKRFPRVVRDLNLQLGKQVNLQIEGEQTLIDRSILETLSDPLMHLLRNAFDHGIEDVETRVAAGKSPEGTIVLQAVNQGTQTVITLADDGGGIALEKIRARLLAMGMPQEYIEQMSDSEVLDCIFEPGFSTATQITELSGRGVGMDVVRTNLRDIRGDVRVETQLGLGTIFTLTIPFTLSILRVAIVEQSGIVFAIPTNSIRELLPFPPEQVTTSKDAELITWKGEKIPLIQLEKTFVFRRPNKTSNLTGNPIIEHTMALVVGDQTNLAGLKISCFWGEQEATIRPIESPFPLPPGFLSSVVLGDGRAIPLVAPLSLAEACLKGNFTENEAGIILAEKERQASTLQAQSQTILVVDDSINVRRYLGLTLEKAGYEVEQAKDGQEAVDKLLGGLRVQAVICDIEMPRLDGYGVLEELKPRAEFHHLPIAMLTSRSNEKHRKLAMNLGASAYFSKPYNEQELIQTLAELLQFRTTN